MALQSNKRKLDDVSDDAQPFLKRHKRDESKAEHDNDDIIFVKFQNEAKEYKKEELMYIEFCKAKLQRWSPDIDDDGDGDTHSAQSQYFIHLTVFPCITPTLFTAVIHLQQILSESDDYYQAAASLLADNIRMNDLPPLFQVCKILLVTKIFNKEIFKYYFDEHPPILHQSAKEFQQNHKNDEFIASIMETQISLYNVMNPYYIQKKVYDLYNAIGNRDCFPYSGNGRNEVPNGENAMRYAMEQIQFEQERDDIRMCQSPDFYIDTLKCDIDYGLCAAFDDMVSSNVNVKPFLDLLFSFINWSLLLNKYLERSHFCFYALAYIVHRIFILYVQRNHVIIKYIYSSDSGEGADMSIEGIFDLFEEILKQWCKARCKVYWYDENEESEIEYEPTHRMQTMIKLRISDCMKWKHEWNICSNQINLHFPIAVIESISNIVKDPQWLIDNFALKCSNSDCRKVMKYILGICTDRLNKNNVSDSVNDAFEQYFGIRVKEMNQLKKQ